MANIITSSKKYCPYCKWTAVTSETYCPMVASNIKMHEYNISVPLLECQPNTSQDFKYGKRNTPKDNPETLKKMHEKQVIKNGGALTLDLKNIRNLQRKARFNGVIRDGVFIPLD